MMCKKELRCVFVVFFLVTENKGNRFLLRLNRTKKLHSPISLSMENLKAISALLFLKDLPDFFFL